MEKDLWYLNMDFKYDAFLLALPVNILIVWAIYTDIKSNSSKNKKYKKNKRHYNEDYSDTEDIILNGKLSLDLNSEEHKKIKTLASIAHISTPEEYIKETLKEAIITDMSLMIKKESDNYDDTY